MSSLTSQPQDFDWQELRKRSLNPGGFGSDRRTCEYVDIIPILSRPRILQVPPPLISSLQRSFDPEREQYTSTNTQTEIPTSSPPHRDERQIKLDTDRSFVLYPVDVKDREYLQQQLFELVVSIFRKRPNLNYFQGYHDIITVLFLTVPPELQLSCAEKLSLHRVRDSMGSGLEPVLGLLRALRNLLRLVDPDYAALLERNSQLPFFALSNLLTLFSHDMPSLPLIQHVFDYLLCRPPIVTVYLAATLILSRKAEVRQLEEEDEDGMIHSLLCTLPDLTDQLVESSHRKPSSFGGDYPGEKQELIHLPPDQPGPEAASLGMDAREKPQPTAYDAPQFTVGLGNDSPKEACPESPDMEKSAESDTTTPPPYPKRPPKLSLPSLLAEADQLYAKYPPNHPSIHLASIMGPQSVVFTWSENPSHLPSDSTAEFMVNHPELIVYPYVEEVPSTKEGDDAAGQKSPAGKKQSRNIRFNNMEGRRFMLAGAVLVLSIAVVLYGIEERSSSGHPDPETWSRLGGWVGEALVEMNEKIWDSLS
ncbi:rab-GTPase-TBC domain-containing protein [Infundibulicybe gibba]|nr:rab-GTPase-TBC domain-containing protein [Infundibulicybe gibba]